MWDSKSFAIWNKELEKGTFGGVESGKNNSVELVWFEWIFRVKVSQ